MARRRAVDHRRRPAVGTMIDLPIGFEIPVAVTHAAVEIRPGSIERQARGLVRRTPDGPAGRGLCAARASNGAAAAPPKAFADMSRRPGIRVGPAAVRGPLRDDGPPAEGPRA